MSMLSITCLLKVATENFENQFYIIILDILLAGKYNFVSLMNADFLFIFLFFGEYRISA